jgi:hypothetical protein
VVREGSGGVNQVLVEERELREIKRLARAENVTLAEWVRRALLSATRREPGVSTAKKLAAVRFAARHSFSTGPIDQMLEEIERLRLS